MVSKKIKALGIIGGSILVLGLGIVSGKAFYQNILSPVIEQPTSLSTQPVDIVNSEPMTQSYIEYGDDLTELKNLVNIYSKEEDLSENLIGNWIDEKIEDTENLEYMDILELKSLHNIQKIEEPQVVVSDELIDEEKEEPVVPEQETDLENIEPMDTLLQEWQGSASEPVEAAYALLARGWKYYPGDREPFGVEDYFPSVKSSLIYNKGDCEDAVLNIAAAVEDDGYAPLMLGIYAEPENSYLNHIVYPYQNEEGKWGLVHIAKSDGRSVVRYITPRFDTVHEMVEHFIIYTGKPYKYYALIDLKKVEQRMDWRTSDDTIELLMSDVIEHTIPENYGDS